MPKKFFSFCIVLAIRVPKSWIPLQVVEVGMYRQGVAEQIQCCVNGTKPPSPGAQNIYKYRTQVCGNL